MTTREQVVREFLTCGGVTPNGPPSRVRGPANEPAHRLEGQGGMGGFAFSGVSPPRGNFRSREGESP